jgi:hypothetical protein
MPRSKKQLSEPTADQVEQHWKAQEKSVFQAPYARDPGVTIANGVSDVERQLVAAQAGQTAPAFRLRNTDTIVADPLARTAELIRKAHDGLSEEEFKAVVASPLDELARLALYGKMSDYQRAQVWQKLYRQAFDEQQAALQEAHRAQQRDAKRTEQLLKGRALQERIEAAKAKRGKVVDGE